MLLPSGDTMECKYCSTKMDISHRSWLANPFCTNCYDDRLKASGGQKFINPIIIDLGNGYSIVREGE
jgi:hypothetical protein